MADYVTTQPDGYQMDTSSLAATLAWSGSFISTITIAAPNGNTYVQTYTNDGTTITGYTGWVKQ